MSHFYEEIELNKEDPRWRQRATAKVGDIYGQGKEEAKEKQARNEKRGRGGAREE